MAADNKAGELSLSSASADGRREYSASQGDGTTLLSGVSAGQSHATGSGQIPVQVASPVRVLPTVHVARHPFAINMAKTVSTTTASFRPYARHMTPVSQGDRQHRGSVPVSVVQPQPSIVSARTLPVVRHAAQPAAVLDLGNNGILNAVLGRLPSIGTMVVHSLEPGSLVQKNIVAMIDGGTQAVTTAPAVANVQPTLSLSYHGSMAVQPPRQVSSQMMHPVSHPLQPIVFSQVGLREPLVACSLAVNRPVALSQSMQQATSPNYTAFRPTVTVRTIASSSSPAQIHRSMSPFVGSRFSPANSSEMIPRVKPPHVASSLPGAVLRYHTTTTVPQSHVLPATQPASQIQPNVSSPVQAQFVVTVPAFVCRSTAGESSHAIMTASTLAPTESLTRIIPPQLAQIPQPHVTVVHSAARLPSVPGHTAAIAVCQADVETSMRLAESSVHIPTCTNVMSTLSMLPSNVTFVSYVPSLAVPRASVPAAASPRGRANTDKTKRPYVRRPPRKKAESLAWPVLGEQMGANKADLLKQMLSGSTVAMSVTSLPQTSVSHASTGSLVAGVKRKCIPGQKYTLLLENGHIYSSVYFDGEGFQSKKPAISPELTGNDGIMLRCTNDLKARHYITFESCKKCDLLTFCPFISSPPGRFAPDAWALSE